MARELVASELFGHKKGREIEAGRFRCRSRFGRGGARLQAAATSSTTEISGGAPTRMGGPQKPVPRLT